MALIAKPAPAGLVIVSSHQTRGGLKMSKFEIVQVGDRYNNKAAVMIERRLFGLVKVMWVKIYSAHPDFDKWHNLSRRDCYGYATMTMSHIEAAYLSLLLEV